MLVANYQQQAREAAQQGDWVRVDQVVAQAQGMQECVDVIAQNA